MATSEKPQMALPPDSLKRDALPLTMSGFGPARTQILELAAFLDRLERHGEEGDIRHEAVAAALDILADDAGNKVVRILQILSDPTEAPIEKSPGKAATGVWAEFGKNKG